MSFSRQALKQLETDTNIANDEALHPIELMAKSYKIIIMSKEKRQIEKKDLMPSDIYAE